MLRAVADLSGDEAGAMAVEYAVLVAFLAAAAFIAVTDLGDVVLRVLTHVSSFFPGPIS